MIGRWRRWAYFERRDDRWQAMVPYRSLRLLENLTDTQNGTARARAISELTDLVLESITLAEGLRDPQVRKRYLALRVSRVKQGGLRSYRLFPRERLRVEVAPMGDLARYLEYSPDAVELIATEQTATARLRIPLDLLEMLELIRNGYRPSPSDLQGLFVNLLIFRNELLNLPFDRIIVTPDEENLYEIAASIGPQRDIRLQVGRFEVTGSGSQGGQK